MTSYELTHFKKMVRVWNTKSLLLCLRYDLLIVFQRQNHITFIFIKANTWPFSADGLCIPCENSRMECPFSPESFQRKNRTTFSKFYLFPGRLQWNAWQTCVPLLTSWEMEKRLRSLVCYTAVFSVVTQRSSPQTAVSGEERCLVADYSFPPFSSEN